MNFDSPLWGEVFKLLIKSREADRKTKKKKTKYKFKMMEMVCGRYMKMQKELCKYFVSLKFKRISFPKLHVKSFYADELFFSVSAL